VSSSHTFTKSDKTLKCSDSDLVRRLLIVLLVLSHSFVLFLEHVSWFLGELRLNGSTELNVGLQLVSCEVWVEWIFLKSVHVYNVLSNHKILVISLLIKDNEEQIESWHDWWWDINVISEGFWSIISTLNWIGSS
jgi:hypothetical protein